jgi:hypothetical protein
VQAFAVAAAGTEAMKLRRREGIADAAFDERDEVVAFGNVPVRVDGFGAGHGCGLWVVGGASVVAVVG